MAFPAYRVASVEDLLARCAPRVRALVEATRRRVLSLVPHATERLRAGWGLLGYDAPAYFAYVWPANDHVRLGFERGVLLPGPAGLLQGEGTQVRWVAIRGARDLRSAAVADLVRAAAALRAPRGPLPPARARRRRRAGG